MNKYTIYSDYYATGEGRTVNVLFITAVNEEAAKQYFIENIRGGEFFIKSAEICDFFDIDNPFVSEIIKPILQKDCTIRHIISLHFNCA